MFGYNYEAESNSFSTLTACTTTLQNILIGERTENFERKGNGNPNILEHTIEIDYLSNL